MSQNAIELHGVTKRFGKKLAVADLDLTCPRGEILGLLGPNGAGKSTTIRMLVGLTEPDSGDIEILGTNTKHRTVAVKRCIGYVPELHNMYRWMSIGELIRFVSAFYPAWDRSLCDDLLEMFELSCASKVRNLSKGMTAKLGLLLAMSPTPELLVLDEPTSGLDPLVREDFLDGVLRANSRSEQTILFSSHHVDDVERLADRIGIIYEGELLLCESTDAISSLVKQVRATLTDGCLPKWTPPEVIWQSISRREWLVTLYPFDTETVTRLEAENDVCEVETVSLSTEDIFKQLIRGRKRPLIHGGSHATFAGT